MERLQMKEKKKEREWAVDLRTEWEGRGVKNRVGVGWGELRPEWEGVRGGAFQMDRLPWQCRNPWPRPTRERSGRRRGVRGDPIDLRSRVAVKENRLCFQQPSGCHCFNIRTEKLITDCVFTRLRDVTVSKFVWIS